MSEISWLHEGFSEERLKLATPYDLQDLKDSLTWEILYLKRLSKKNTHAQAMLKDSRERLVLVKKELKLRKAAPKGQLAKALRRMKELKKNAG